MASPSPVPPKVRFGAFELNPEAGKLFKNGIPLKLQPQPFRLLMLLSGSPGQVVTREEIQRCLWGDSTFVDFERGINFSINQIRAALNDHAEKPRYIETLPRLGYRFIGVLEPPDQTAQGTKPPSLLLVAKQDSSVTAVVPKMNGYWPVAATAILVLSFVAAGVYWFTKRTPPAPREVKLRQLTFGSAENAVSGGAISPDGKYLSYLDRKGIHLRLMKTGETQVVPEPEALKGGKVEWEICAWFPDSTRFLVNAHPPGLFPEHWTSQGSSIWVVSVLSGPPRELRDDAVAYSISPDGSTIAFGTNKGAFGDREIWLMGVDGEKARKLYESDENSAVGGFGWFPHGQRVFYSTTDKSGYAMVSRELSGGPVTTIFPPLDMKKIQDIAVLPDERIVYSLQEPDAANCDYWVVGLDERTGNRAGKPARLTNLGESCMGGTSVTADGKKLVFAKGMAHFQVYVSDVAPNGKSISATRRLTLTESSDFPADWTPDSKAVIFVSNRNGPRGIFKQSLTDDTAEPLVTGSELMLTGILHTTPDGAWVVYEEYTKSNDRSAGSQVKRVPITGGPSEFVLTANFPGIPLCAGPQAALCTIAESTENRKQIILTTFDPLKGRGHELARLDVDLQKKVRGKTEGFQYDISPDGTRILWAKFNGEVPSVHILSLRGQPPLEFNVKGWSKLEDIEWAANGKALFISHGVPGGSVLLQVDLQGNAHVLWQQHGGKFTYGRPSPDGRHLAMLGWAVDSNLWMMENF